MKIQHHKDKLRSGWLTPKELPFFINFIACLFRFSSEFKVDCKNFSTRLLKLYKFSGWNFTFQYMKESSRLLIRVMMTGVASPSLGKPFVRIDKDGYPSFIPLRWRQLLKSHFQERFNAENVFMVVGILTILNIFRCFPAKAPINLSTITGPFSGLVRTMDFETIEKALNDLGCGSLRLGDTKFVPLSTSGPNARIAMWGSLLDMISLIKHPKILLDVYKYILYSKQWTFLVLFSFINVLMYIVYMLTPENSFENLRNGQLGVVYDQAGKSRIIAMTNWWIQCVFKPLHSGIFDFLKSIDSVDGTFNQEGCLSEFIKRIPSDQTIYSFDLSAATDRLPLDLQIDILKKSINPHIAELWGSIIRKIDWYYEGEFYKYSVGQPMGALSSWAMLALTHHTIVRMSALKAGISNFTDYLVLGDDIVIANDAVSENYRDIMTMLGLEINMQKSLVSKRGCEFAKKWIIDKVDYSPFGAKLLLQGFRSPDALYLTLVDLLKRKLVSLLGIPAVLEDLPKRFWSLKGWVLLALISSFYFTNKDTRTQFNEYATQYPSGIRRFFEGDRLKRNLINSYISDFNAMDIMKTREFDNLLNTWWKIDYFKHKSSKLWGILNLFNPALWLTLKKTFSYNKDLWDDLQWVLSIKDIRDNSWDILCSLKNLCLHPDVFSVDFRDKVMVADLRRSTYEFFDGIKPWDVISQLFPYGPMANMDRRIFLEDYKPKRTPLSIDKARRKWLPLVKTR